MYHIWGFVPLQGAISEMHSLPFTFVQKSLLSYDGIFSHFQSDKQVILGRTQIT